MAYKVSSFGFSLFGFCCGCAEGTKYGNGQYYPGKHQIHSAFFGFMIAAQEQTFLHLLVASHICRVPAKKKLLDQT